MFGHGFLLQPRREDVEVGRQRGRPVRTRRSTTASIQLRYFFLREVPFGQDGNYSHEAIVSRINADLANDLGNLAQRSLSMIAKNCDGAMPEPGEFTDADKAMLAAADALYVARRARRWTGRRSPVTLEACGRVIADANRYFAGEEPWANKKTDPERMATMLYVTAEVLRQIAILVQPVMPGSADKLLDLLAQPENARYVRVIGRERPLEAGDVLPAPRGVFPRYVEPEDETAEAAPANRRSKKAAEGRERVTRRSLAR